MKARRKDIFVYYSRPPPIRSVYEAGTPSFRGLLAVTERRAGSPSAQSIHPSPTGEGWRVERRGEVSGFAARAPGR